MENFTSAVFLGKLSVLGAELIVWIFVVLQENPMNVYDLPTQLPQTQPVHINRFLFKTFYSKGDYDSKIQAQPYPDTLFADVMSAA